MSIDISDDEFTKFLNAIKSGETEEVQTIIRRGPSSIVNKLDNQFGQPALYFAVLAPDDEKSEELIKLLIRYGANIKLKDSVQQTVLFYVCREGKVKCAEALLSQGMNLDQADKYGQTPLFYAVSENRLELVKAYATTQRVNHADKLANQTPLYYAARRGHLEMAKLLIEKGAQISHIDNSHKTAVEYAKKAKFSQVADFLGAELRRYRQTNKLSMASPSLEESNLERRRKKEDLKPIRQTYKIVFLNQRGELRDLTEEDVRQMIKIKPELQLYLSNPESIPQELVDRSNNDGWEKTATKILAQCCKLKGAYWFLQAVDPVKFNIMDYFDIIKEPMDLGMVRKKMNHNGYGNVHQFVRDMSLIWENCYKYNGDSHDISKCAKEVEVNFKEYCQSYGLNKYINEN